ncbi:carboxypeptidase-like regulatory domain-containing protein [Pseudobacter ginsenosidimutans]|uniref:Carboxypeptidase family protein n=1 Tax=Pseudobacter ginsenosidimutans TaxID=661488 RepID=A0A4V2F208_9BACT|nr:carboxypeptidase-like regulatory domain-containing protein [Pseudobacter ginsenosidimutans]QEC44175.1 carboxypeptidase regulatory-like domain-containing protein [Pseudobacter ginsenosidimutans]RZS75627.1 hypothetical protein EV199_1497 [Pseudobacter ginsenosidimutans]
MKKTRLLPLLLLASLVSIYIACQRDDYGSLPSGPNPAEKTQISISGRVLDDENLPVNGALVKAGNLTANTDLNGNFQIKNVTLDANASFVKVEKAGFFSGSRTFKGTKGSTHYVSIQLIKKNDAGSFASDAGGDITVPNGGSVSFEAGSIIDAQTKSPYTGTVSVSAFWLNPTVDNFLEIMPGELRGVDENDKQVGLQSFGMMVVELTGASGEKLQLTGSKPATMKFPIAPAQQASAPATIAFWSFNDTTGLWKQEGMATRQGNEYIGKASHFSFWNCDAPFTLVDFKATLKGQDGNPVKGFRVVLKTADDETGPTASSYTDTAGVVAGLIPAGRRLKMTVFGKCNDELLSQEIGPFSAATDLGNITVNIPADSKVTFTGEILNCSGSPLQNGFADIGIQGKFERAPIVNGVLNYSFIRCGSNDTKASVRITDIGNSIIGGIKEADVIANVASLGEITVCEEDLGEYLIYTMDTISRQFLPPADTAGVYTSELYHYVYHAKRDTSDAFYLQFTPDASGTVFTPGYSYVYVRKIMYLGIEPITLQITEYGAQGEYIAGKFSGKMRAENNAILPINGRFRLKRM